MQTENVDAVVAAWWQELRLRDCIGEITNFLLKLFDSSFSNERFSETSLQIN